MLLEYIWVIFWMLFSLGCLLALIPMWRGIRRENPSVLKIAAMIALSIFFIGVALLGLAVMNFSPCGPGILERVIQDFKSRW